MPFSLTSYLLGVGTVVGALAFGFGGGVLLTKTAMKETAAGPMRVERVAHSEPELAAPTQQQDAKDNSSPPAEPAPAARPDPAPAAQAATLVARPQPDTRREAESAKGPEPSTKQPEPTKQVEPASQKEQKEATQMRATERKVERHKRSAERKAGSVAMFRMRQPSSEDLDQREPTGPEPTEFVFGREEPHFFGREERQEEQHFNLFQMLSPPRFDRSYDRDD
jgi:hypothetical protein